jgi:hypothetical protein
MCVLRSAWSRHTSLPATTTASLKAGDARAGFGRDDRGPLARLARKPTEENAILQLFCRAARG